MRYIIFVVLFDCFNICFHQLCEPLIRQYRAFSHELKLHLSTHKHIHSEALSKNKICPRCPFEHVSCNCKKEKCKICSQPDLNAKTKKEALERQRIKSRDNMRRYRQQAKNKKENSFDLSTGESFGSIECSVDEQHTLVTEKMVMKRESVVIGEVEKCHVENMDVSDHEEGKNVKFEADTTENENIQDTGPEIEPKTEPKTELSDINNSDAESNIVLDIVTTS